MKNLIIAEHDNNQLHADTLKVVNAASQAGQDNTLLVIGYQCEEVAQQASRLDGIAKVICIDDESLVHQFAENIAPVVVGLADSFDGIWLTHRPKAKILRHVSPPNMVLDRSLTSFKWWMTKRSSVQFMRATLSLK